MLTASTIYCTRCGVQTSTASAFCSNCGAALPQVASQPAASQPAAFSTFAAVAAAPLPAGFWIRFVALIIDWIVVQIVILPVVLVLGIMIGIAGATVAMPSEGIEVVGGIVGFVLGIGGAWLYEAWMTSSTKQATLGKLALGLKVTDTSGARLTFARATGRHFAKYVSGMILAIGYIMAAFTERKQALHDLIAGTYVIQGR